MENIWYCIPGAIVMVLLVRWAVDEQRTMRKHKKLMRQNFPQYPHLWED